MSKRAPRTWRGGMGGMRAFARAGSERACACGRGLVRRRPVASSSSRAEGRGGTHPAALGTASLALTLCATPVGKASAASSCEWLAMAASVRSALARTLVTGSCRGGAMSASSAPASSSASMPPAPREQKSAHTVANAVRAFWNWVSASATTAALCRPSSIPHAAHAPSPPPPRHSGRADARRGSPARHAVERRHARAPALPKRAARPRTTKSAGERRHGCCC